MLPRAHNGENKIDPLDTREAGWSNALAYFENAIMVQRRGDLKSLLDAMLTQNYPA
jgi:hypothetical protein